MPPALLKPESGDGGTPHATHRRLRPLAVTLGGIRGRLRDLLSTQAKPVEEPRGARRQACHRTHWIGDNVGCRLERFCRRLAHGLKEYLALAHRLQLLNSGQFRNADAEQFPPGHHKGPQVRTQGKVAHESVGGDVIVYSEERTRKQFRRQEIGCFEDRRRLEGGLGCGRGCRCRQAGEAEDE